MSAIYAEPREVTVGECAWYQVMDVPGHGTMPGRWDLRETADAYLGNVDFQGKRVLELGTASGFFCFHMESKGADVVAVDLSPDHSWDVLLSPSDDEQAIRRTMRAGQQKLNNAFWLGHRAYNSKARFVHSTVYDVPEELGQFDIVTLCAILLHLRDPLLALQLAAQRATESVIIVDRKPDWMKKIKGPFARFMPSPEGKTPHGGWTWWHFSPDVLVAMLKMLGYEHFELTTSKHLYVPTGKKIELYTLVASRTDPSAG